MRTESDSMGPMQVPDTALYGASTADNLSAFYGSQADGTWTLFVADLSAGGGTADLVSATLTVVTVPEPQTMALLSAGLALIGFGWNRRHFRR